jgi:hypothetical protein
MGDGSEGAVELLPLQPARVRQPRTSASLPTIRLFGVPLAASEKVQPERLMFFIS